MSTYPVFLAHIETQRAVIVGANGLAARKACELTAAGFGEVAIIAPRTPAPELLALVGSERLTLTQREPVRDDFRGVTLVVASDGDEVLNAWLGTVVRAAGGLLLAMDDPAHCDVYGGAIVRRGEVTVAIGTGGAAPALAAKLRQQLERWFDRVWPELAELSGLLRALRPWVAERIVEYARRRDAYRVLLADGDLRRLLRRGHVAAAVRHARNVLANAAENESEPSVAPSTAELLRFVAPQLALDALSFGGRR
jgi:siroheme synthase-like protein